MVGSGLVLRVEARLRKELWRRVCVRWEYWPIDSYSLTFSRLNLTECRGYNTEPNDTSTSDVIIAQVKYPFYNLEPFKLQLATDCLEVAEFTNLEVYCHGKSHTKCVDNY